MLTVCVAVYEFERTTDTNAEARREVEKKLQQKTEASLLPASELERAIDTEVHLGRRRESIRPTYRKTTSWKGHNKTASDVFDSLANEVKEKDNPKGDVSCLGE